MMAQDGHALAARGLIASQGATRQPAPESVSQPSPRDILRYQYTFTNGKKVNRRKNSKNGYLPFILRQNQDYILNNAKEIIAG